jgi:aspartyl aminopeptidase
MTNRNTHDSGALLSELMAFLDASPSPHHVVRSSLDRLGAAGFEQLRLGDHWESVPRRGVVVREGALIAWCLPSNDRPEAGLHLLGAHTDSPGLRIKPQPDREAMGWKQLGVEVYGGILNNSWLDRDLSIAGAVIDADGTRHLVNVRTPVARVPQLAVHLDRNVNESGLVLDRQQHLTPIWGVGTGRAGEFAEWIADQAGIDSAQWWELCLFDVQPAAVLGSDSSMLASGRLDNQLSCWAGVEAIARSSPQQRVAMVVLNDHEEVGSASATGASGPLLEQTIERLVRARGGNREHLLCALADSACVSADNAHAVHPNYGERHDPDHRPIVNSGPAIKINANQRYATSASTAAMFQSCCEQAQVPWQVFVSRNNMPCGSTIGPLTATRLGIDTVDVGIPQLSMHSARELCGVRDPGYLARALEQYLSH